MVLGDLINSFRNQIGEASTRRFTNAILTDWANRAQNQLAFEVDFPEATQTIVTVPGQQEYQLTELIKILRVYIVGPDGSKQELPGTDIPTLEGDKLFQYDNSSGIIQSAPVQSPQWLNTQQTNYPTVNVPITGAGSGPIPMNSSYTPYARPKHYLRGGYIGIVPTPGLSNPQFTLAVDHIPLPPALNVTSDKSLYPDHFLDALVWLMVGYARFSDNTAAYKDAVAMFNDQMAMKIRPWLEHIQATRPKTFVPRTVRSQFRTRRGRSL
jgi:hypothetical protein